MSQDLSQLAAEAFVYGYPLVSDVTALTRISRDGMASLPPSPFNTFAHATTLAGPDAKFVSINNDTLYSMAHLDLSGGPLRLDTPDTGGKYYVLQFIDAWTNNFAYVGRRSTGTAAATYLLVPPGWQGEARDGWMVIECPTMVASIVGRIACDGHDDLPNVARLQRGLRLTPLSPDAAVAGVPSPATGVAEDLAFLEQVRVFMAAYPPSAADQEYQRRFTPLGLLEAATPYPDLPADRTAQISAGLAAAKRALEERILKGGSPDAHGWNSTLHIFDYNLDHLGPGTIDSPRWKIADRAAAYQVRMIAARGGLWGNHGYEAAYPMIRLDADGQQLNGAHSYTLTFAQTPPVDAFWSLTMYDTPDYYLVDNPINRYSIGDRTPGLRHSSDGSLTIVLQRDQPTDPVEAANWLPTPAGDFRPCLRLYQPGTEVLDETYQLPPITRRD